jgi:D-glycero-D-manno-heptose 1,7-bisphosphate phosphatase
MNKAVFLDRDGVLCDAIVTNYKPLSAKGMDDLSIPVEVVNGCWKLKQDGFKLLCVSNQPDIARGFISPEVIDAQNKVIRHYCFLDDIITCPHDNSDNCFCRKPKPGMIFNLARKWNIDLRASYLIGDRWSDIDAGFNAGIDMSSMVFIDRGYHEQQPPAIVKRVHFFEEAVQTIFFEKAVQTILTN